MYYCKYIYSRVYSRRKGEIDAESKTEKEKTNTLSM